MSASWALSGLLHSTKSHGLRSFFWKILWTLEAFTLKKKLEALRGKRTNDWWGHILRNLRPWYTTWLSDRTDIPWYYFIINSQTFLWPTYAGPFWSRHCVELTRRGEELTILVSSEFGIIFPTPTKNSVSKSKSTIHKPTRKVWHEHG
jgi:hypothetical protein